MALKRDSGCPLCGAKMSAREVLNACAELVDADLGVLAASCPYCQGYFEVRPGIDKVELGYLVAASSPRFDVVISLPCPGLGISRDDAPAGRRVLRVDGPDGSWSFREA